MLEPTSCWFCFVFYKCSVVILKTFFQTYCTNMYCPYLWSYYTQMSYSKIRVAFNKGFRNLWGYSRRDSASAMFLSHNLGIYSLWQGCRSPLCLLFIKCIKFHIIILLFNHCSGAYVIYILISHLRVYWPGTYILFNNASIYNRQVVILYLYFICLWAVGLK